jgi:CHASE2 domain-containing sensor protein/signal transduction histidine kinase
MNLRRRLLIEWLLIALIGTLAVVLAAQWRGTAAFDNLVYDQLSAYARPEPDEKVLLINIDEPSLAQLGKWPWDRNLHAQLIEKLTAAKPRAILLDVLLSEPGPAEDDQALVAAIRNAANVYLPINFHSPGTDGRAFDTELPIPELVAAARATGHVNVAFDNDGIVRRVNLCFRPDAQDSTWPHITEQVYRGKGKPSPAFTRLGSCDEELMLPYSPRDGFDEISFVDALNGTIPEDLVRGRDVIIGATAAGMGDNYPGPFSDGGIISGSEIMANMLAAMRRDDFVEPVSKGLTLALSLLPMWLLLVGFLRWKPRTTLVASLLLVALVLLGSASALATRIWFPPGAALLGVLLVYPLWGWRRLQAVSAFMEDELGDLQREGNAVPIPVKEYSGSDLVERQSAALAGAIDHMRDLRRFVSDALEHLPDPMFVTGVDNKVTMANHRIEQYLGALPPGMPLQAVLDQIVAPSQRHLVEDYLARGHPAESENDAEYVRFVSPDHRHFVMRSAPVENDAGEAVGTIYYLAEISALAQAEADREQALQLLSHDMRAPQSAIIALLPKLSDGAMGARIEGHARRTIQLAQDFVDIARMGETPFEGGDVLLADLAREMADSLWPLAQERGVKIEVEDDSNSAFVLAEPDGLGRAITNILDNAIKYSPTGGVIRVHASRVQNGTTSMIELAICDEGGGIDADLLPQLFTRFAAKAKPGARIKSSGLGLNYVRAVIERHGGRIWAENVGKGACFRMQLPEAL